MCTLPEWRPEAISCSIISSRKFSDRSSLISIIEVLQMCVVAQSYFSILTSSYPWLTDSRTATGKYTVTVVINSALQVQVAGIPV